MFLLLRTASVDLSVQSREEAVILNPGIKTPSKQLETGELHTSKNYTERISGNVRRVGRIDPQLAAPEEPAGDGLITTGE